MSKPKNFFIRHKEHIKIGAVCTISTTSVVLLAVSIILKWIDISYLFLAIAPLVQMMFAILINTSPQTITALKDRTKKLLNDEDTNTVSEFLDDITTFSQTRSLPPVPQITTSNEPQATPTPSNVIPMNAYYNPRTDKYLITPRTDKDTQTNTNSTNSGNNQFSVSNTRRF